MSELVRVAVDAMGGDNAPEAVVQGVVDALNASKEIEVLLVGDQKTVEKCLAGAQYDKERLQVIHASEVITNNEHRRLPSRRRKILLLLSHRDLSGKEKQMHLFLREVQAQYLWEVRC